MLSVDAEASVEMWNALGRNISPDRAQLLDDRHLSVPIERLLVSRNWLGQLLTTYGCALDVTLAVQELLDRQDRERQHVDEALAGQIEPADFAASLQASRFIRDMRAFQQRDLAQLLALRHGANFSVPGAGKTTVAYALYETLRQREHVEQLLVVAPISAFDAWETEADICLDPTPVVKRLDRRPAARAEVVLVNYQRLSGRRFDHIAEWVQRRPTHLILDEAHRMKRGRRGEWGAACLDLAQLAVRRDVLTGTPAPQSAADFVALLDFLWPEQSRRIVPQSALASVPDDSALQLMSHRLRPLFARTRKDELGLRRPCLHVECAPMKPLQERIYAALRTRMARVVRAGGRDQATLSRMGAVTMYLLQAASNPGLLAAALGTDQPPTRWPSVALPASSDIADLIRRYGQHEMPAKFDKLATMIAANAGQDRKTLVWSNFVGNLQDLGRVLAPHQPATIHGGIPSGRAPVGRATREQELDRFRHDDYCMVLLANPAAMSEGISLHHDCQDAIYVDRTFNAGQYLQSLDRIHRLGLAETTTTRMTFLACPTTIDETVDRRVRIKAERLGALLNDEDLVTMALPDEEEGYGEWIDADDLDELFAHLVDDDA
ncbi:MAG: SNF2-related protein [Solirubrobacteraceae bacterium]